MSGARARLIIPRAPLPVAHGACQEAAMDPLAAAEAAIAADHAHADPALWITRVADGALRAQARELEAEGAAGRPLWGLVVAVKDNIDVAGLPTTAACPAFAYMPERDALCVQRLRAAGALVMGKTNLDQFATGLVGTRSPYGTPRNVFDAARVPGGSSSGSAAAVAAGIVAAALGTDTAGSGRVPAMFGNIVGWKPTIGSVPATGVVPACRSIDTVSIFARDVDLALRIARVLSGDDGADPYAREAPFPHLRRGALPAHARVARIAPTEAMGAGFADSYDRACALFAAETVPIEAFLRIARLLYEGPWVAERTAALRGIVAAQPEALHPVTRRILEAGFARLTVDAFDAFHDLARTRRLAADLFRRHDALILPTTLPAPTLAEVEAEPIAVNAALGTWTNFVNLCDLAAIAVPIGFLADGRPVGVTVVGPAWSEGRLAPIAERIHRAMSPCAAADRAALPPPAPEPEPPAAGLGPDETALFCVGGHMAGLPLNHELVALGGRFLSAARTAPQYRLYALGARPGLVRQQDGGAAIEGEIWCLPTASIGALLARVPAPLGFGIVHLASGDCLGFLAEAAAAAGGKDITDRGGWRAWLTAG
jgi:allophanate hydrolase